MLVFSLSPGRLYSNRLIPSTPATLGSRHLSYPTPQNSFNLIVDLQLQCSKSI
jgi:hypothetical protein